MKTKVISRSQIATHIPIWETLVVFIILHVYQHPGWVDGVVWTVMALGWLAVIHSIITTKPVKIDLDLMQREGGLKS